MLAEIAEHIARKRVHATNTAASIRGDFRFCTGRVSSRSSGRHWLSRATTAPASEVADAKKVARKKGDSHSGDIQRPCSSFVK